MLQKMLEKNTLEYAETQFDAGASILDANIFCAEWEMNPAPVPHDLQRSSHSKAGFLPGRAFHSARLAYRRLSYASGRKISPFTLYETESVIFIHIPKNAGTFVNGIVYPGISSSRSTHINAHHSVHYLAKLDPIRFGRLPKFAILRHPAQRLQSAFNYLKYHSPFQTDREFASRHLSGFSDFDMFCRNETEQGFEAFLFWPHFQPQVSFLCDATGRLCVDALTTLEMISEGLRSLGDCFGKNWALESNTLAPGDHCPEVMRLVEKYYAKDLKLWSAVQNSEQHFCLVR
ncbi:sulfotransferase family 2 domain-containing protein [Aliiroseovarius sp. KMU-50]|uniref:Sulfotransferase family 2 domain-containing protein n=1 Tax=Aliiroseovarius salicola TaxID=3009082 RepID=A0ABT4VXY4_9RHOB|nr:sulfotransferase family 2 domain-containing protein [Aliiroseovarius sp. KMU-50]MDA5093081.1 sulfotransferase family 2 domain-containing protein [Aliiroseovarius sp. KMU-50]